MQAEIIELSQEELALIAGGGHTAPPPTGGAIDW
jgi:hypothetical protein